jgi:steroid 5-alpha reductase family enzyme
VCSAEFCSRSFDFKRLQVTIIQLAAMAVLCGAGLSMAMALAWYAQQRTGNSGWIDVTWSFSVGVVGGAAACWPLTAGGPQWRQLCVALAGGIWCLRLGAHIASRSMRKGDDPRYRDLMQQWGDDAARRLFQFLQAQAGVGLVLVLTMALAAHNPDPRLRLQDILGLLVLAGAVWGESAADQHLRRFAADPSNRGRVCDVGLWRWSRHPNYFFEFLAWAAYPIIAIDFAGYQPLGWLALSAPACMYWILVHVSGVPPLEAHMMRTRGEAFREYQRRTPVFIPFLR